MTKSRYAVRLLTVISVGALFLIRPVSDAEQRGPPPPPGPLIELVPGDQRVTILWGHRDSLRSERHIDPWPPFFPDFEGYKLYRSYSSNEQEIAGWELLAQWDLEDRWVFHPGDSTITYWIDIGYDMWPPPGNTYPVEYPDFKYGFTDSEVTNYYPLYYCVTAFDFGNPVTGVPSQESWPSYNAEKVFPNPRPGEFLGEKRVVVVPNPYKLGTEYPAWFANGDGIGVNFIDLPPWCTIRIYTLGGDLIATIDHRDTEVSVDFWDLKSRASKKVAAGIYLFSVAEHPSGLIQVGKFVVIK